MKYLLGGGGAKGPTSFSPMPIWKKSSAITCRMGVNTVSLLLDWKQDSSYSREKKCIQNIFGFSQILGHFTSPKILYVLLAWEKS